MTTANGQTPAPFMQDAPAVISTLGTDAHQGLTSEQAAHNLNQYGPNAFTKPKPESMLSRIAKTAADPMLIMLMIAAAITLGVNITRAMARRPRRHSRMRGHLLSPSPCPSTITVVMEGRSAKAFEALNDINDDTTVTVVRDGEVTLVSQRDITIGDVLQISTGDKLPADARLIESNDLTADESALTGESVPSAKAADAVFTDPKTPVADRTNMLYSGCFVTAGNGRAVVTARGRRHRVRQDRPRTARRQHRYDAAAGEAREARQGDRRGGLDCGRTGVRASGGPVRGFRHRLVRHDSERSSPP